MSTTPSPLDPKAYHIITYGTLLGSSVFNTFLAGPIAYKALPRASFATLQTAQFPIYFALQTVLPVVLALSWPGAKIAAAGTAIVRRHAGIFGLLEKENRWTGLVPIAVMFGTSLLNLVALGPATTKIMKERKHQETRDGKKYFEAGPKSPEMQRLNSSFLRLHGASSLANLLGVGAMIFYGFGLAERL